MELTETNSLEPIVKSVIQELAIKQFQTLQMTWREAHSARDFSRLKNILDTEAAFRKFVQDQDLGDELKDDITADYLHGERALGELWRERPKNQGTRNQLAGPGIIGGSKSAPPIDIATAADLGLDKKRAARDLCFDDLELAKFDKIIAGRRVNNDLSVFGV